MVAISVDPYAACYHPAETGHGMRVVSDSDQTSLFATMSPIVSPETSAEAGALMRPADAGVSETWVHTATGIAFPRGTVVTSACDSADLDRIADGSQRRGVQAFAALSRKVKRSARDESQLQAFCEWLASKDLDILGTVTYSEEYANSHRIYSLKAALQDVAAGLREIPMVRGTIRGYRGRYVLAGEWHPSGRQVPHVHLALDSMGVVDSDKVCADLFRYFKSTRGRSRFEPMRDTSTATLYGLKDTIKASEHDPDSLVLKMGRHKKVRRNNR